MISLMLSCLALAWFVLLASFPRFFARRQPICRSIPRYHYSVCGNEELPTWQRKPAGPAQKKSTAAR